MAKSTRPMVRVHDSETNEVIDREMNDAEFAEHNKMFETLAAEKADREAKEMAKAALLERLGITQDEANLLLS